MADKKISSMGEITSLSPSDYFPFIDVSQPLATNKNKRITYGSLAQNLGVLTQVSQSTHGFVVGNLIRFDEGSGIYVKSQADSEANAWVDGIVTSVTDVNSFYFCPAHGARITGIGGGALVGGKKYYLSAATAGAYTITAPTIERLVFTAISDSVILFHNEHSSSISDAFADNEFYIYDEADATKKLVFSVGGNTTGKTLTIISQQTGDANASIPDITGGVDTFLMVSASQQVKSKTILTDCLFSDALDTSKKLEINLAGNTTAKKAMFTFNCTNNVTYTFPDVSGTVLLGAGVDGRVAVYEGTNEIGAIAGFTYDGTTLGLPATNNITGAGSLTITATGATLALAATGANIITFSTNGAEKMRIAGDGKVGIGCTPTNASWLELGVINTAITAYGTAAMFVHGNGEADNIVLTTTGTTNRYSSIQFRGTNPGATTQNWSVAQISSYQIGSSYQQGQFVIAIASANNTFLRTLTVASFSSTARIGIGNKWTSAVPSYNLSFDGNAAQTIGLERHTTSNTAGVTGTLTLSGGATSGATDKDAGMGTFKTGISTGTGKASLRYQRLSRAASTGTTDNTFSDAIIIPSEFNLTDAGNNDLFEIALAANELTGGHIDFTIIASDGTDHQSYTGTVIFSAVDKAGTLSTSIVESPATYAVSVGTLSTAWSIVDGTNKITIRVVPTSSLTPTTMKIRYTIHNGGTTALTQL